MAYDWPAGWNDTRLENAVHEWVCDTLDVPKYACRVQIDNQHARIPKVQIFKPLTGKATADVHRVFARLVPFARKQGPCTWLRVGVPERRIDEYTYELRYIDVNTTDPDSR
jgi:hypothetical protein